MPSTKESLVLDELTLDALNLVLAKIQDALDELRGLRGTVQIKDEIQTDTGVSYVDSNGTTIHGFGDV
jgi:hypothetical protein